MDIDVDILNKKLDDDIDNDTLGLFLKFSMEYYKCINEDIDYENVVVDCHYSPYFLFNYHHSLFLTLVKDFTIMIDCLTKAKYIFSNNINKKFIQQLPDDDSSFSE